MGTCRVKQIILMLYEQVVKQKANKHLKYKIVHKYMLSANLPSLAISFPTTNHPPPTTYIAIIQNGKVHKTPQK